MRPEDEQKLTSYALDELDDAARAEVEALLDASPEARAAFSEIKETAHLLEAELHQEPCPQLTEEQAAAILDQACASPKRRWAVVGLALAASLALLAGSVYVLWQSMPTNDQDRLTMAKGEPGIALFLEPAQEIPAELLEQMEALGYLNSTEDGEGTEEAGTDSFSTSFQSSLPEEEAERIANTGIAYARAFLDHRSAGQAAPLPDSDGHLTGDAIEDAPGNLQNVQVGGEIRIRDVDELGAARHFFRSRAEGPQTGQDGAEEKTDIASDGAYGYGAGGANVAGKWSYQGGYGRSGGHGGALGGGVYGGHVAADTDGDSDTITATHPTPIAKPGSPPPEKLKTLGYLGEPATVGKLIASGDSLDRTEYLVRTLNRNDLAWVSHEAATGSTGPWVSREVATSPTGPDVSSTESYQRIVENPFLSAAQRPLSTFSIDVDTASYANVRRFLTQGQWPPADAVRIEELVNYFAYDYAPPEDEHPFAVHTEIVGCPWTPDHRLVRIGLKGREIDPADRKPCNFVFLLDVSGSMKEDNKLSLLKKALSLLVGGLNKDDTVSIVTFANEARLHLSPTTCDQKQVLRAAIDELAANGGTNGGAGLELAYDLAREHALEDGNNRVIVGTDGDFNQGVTDKPELVKLIQDCAKSGVFLTVLGLGEGNLQDSNLEALADKGNGNYAYIDTFNEARRVLCEQMAGTLVTIAKDVKIQVEFNPGKVSAYRLIGYENRVMTARDFNDDRKDAGDVGAGHTVTALYEIVPVGVAGPMPGVDNLRFQQPPEPPENLKDSDELLWVKLRYKQPDGSESVLLEFPLTDTGKSFDDAPADTRFAAAVAAFGMLLRNSDAKGNATFDSVLELARAAKGPDPQGYRAEFINLVTTAKSLGK